MVIIPWMCENASVTRYYLTDGGIPFSRKELGEWLLER